MSLEVKSKFENDNNNWLFEVSGELDISCSEYLKDEINKKLDEKYTDIKFDMSNLSYIDSTGIGILVGIMKKLKENEKNIFIVKAKDNVKKIFGITGLDKIISMEG